MAGDILPFRSPAVAAAIRAEAIRRGIPIEEFLVFLALRGWERLQQAQAEAAPAAPMADQTD